MRLSTSSIPPRAKKRLRLWSQSSRLLPSSKLAYEIDDQTEGYYVLMSFSSGAEFPAELDRVFGITDGIMRSMIVCRGE